MNFNKICNNIDDFSHLNERSSLPLYINNLNKVIWFNYCIDLENDICYSTSIYECNPDGENIKEELKVINSELISNDNMTLEVDCNEYFMKLEEIKDIDELLSLILKTSEYTFIQLYEEIIKKYMKE